MPQAPGFSRLGLLLLCLAAGATAPVAAGQLERLTASDPGSPSVTPAGESRFSALSADGRYVVFTSGAANVVSGQTDANGGTDVFLRDQVAGTTVLVSRSSDSASGSANNTGNAASSAGRISADGRWVLFESRATNLVPGQADTPDTADLFLYDRVTGATTLVSRSTASSHQTGNAPSSLGAISADGRWVVFTSPATDLVRGQVDPGLATDVFLYDRIAGTTTLVSRAAGFPLKAGNAESFSAGELSISADGGQILFWSAATDLLPGGITSSSSSPQLYLFDRATGATALVSHAFSSATAGVGTTGRDAALSADGRFVAFVSDAATLVPGTPDPRGGKNVFLYDHLSGAIARVTAAAGYEVASPRLSADGRYLALASDAMDLAPGQTGAQSGTNVFLYDRIATSVTLVSRSLTAAARPSGSGVSYVSISADGHFVAYISDIPDLASGQIDVPPLHAESTTDVFLFDRIAGTNRLVSHAADSDTVAAGGADGLLAISANGRFVGFGSNADALAAMTEEGRDFNRTLDVFLYDPGTSDNTLVSRREGPPLPVAGFSRAEAITPDGRYVLIASDLQNLVPGQRDANHQSDLFLYDRVTRTRTLVSRSAASPATAGNGLALAEGLSADGRFALFLGNATDAVPGQSDGNGGLDVFLFDRSTAALTLVSHRAGSPSTTGDHSCFNKARISADGRFVAFNCTASDLVPGQSGGSSLVDNVFLYDRVTGATTLASHAVALPTTAASAGAQIDDLSADGRFVSFTSYSTNLVAGPAPGPYLTTNVFLFDRDTGAVTLVSHVPASPTAPGNGESSSSRLSADGRFVAFRSSADNLVPGAGYGVYLFDRLSGALTFAGPGSHLEGISADGRIVAFTSQVHGVVPGQVDPDPNRYYANVFLYDRVSGATTLASRGATPTTTLNRDIDGVYLSADGNAVTFSTSATNAVPGFLATTSPQENVFLFRRTTGTVELLSRALDSPVRSGNGFSFVGAINADGRFVAFDSQATNLVPGTFASASLEVYLYSQDGTTPGGPVTLPPCQLFDGALRSNVRKLLAAAGACGVPAGAKQVLVKVTASRSTGKGNVQFFPGNVTAPASGILRFARGQTVGASFTLPLGNGGIALLPFVAGKGTVRVSVEVDGYTP